MKYFATFIVLFTTYVFLAGFAVTELIVGGIVSLVLSIILASSVNYTLRWDFPFKLIIFIFVYIPVFTWELIKANIDIARRVLSPKIPLNSGFVKVNSELKGDFAKLTLANSITLTPGTLSIDVVDQDVFVHCVDVPQDTSTIKSPFENILRRVFK